MKSGGLATIGLYDFNTRLGKTVEPMNAVRSSIPMSGLDRLDAVDRGKGLLMVFIVHLCLNNRAKGRGWSGNRTLRWWGGWGCRGFCAHTTGCREKGNGSLRWDDEDVPICSLFTCFVNWGYRQQRNGLQYLSIHSFPWCPLLLPITKINKCRHSGAMTSIKAGK